MGLQVGDKRGCPSRGSVSQDLQLAFGDYVSIGLKGKHTDRMGKRLNTSEQSLRLNKGVSLEHHDEWPSISLQTCIG